ncbi:citrate lyase subunit alpha, partial [Clostridium sp.]|uniref:citrate lyase subunit alpha n=1 Tax=Clostridium sp. TaxID=1506 RepID=UPI001A591E7F
NPKRTDLIEKFKHINIPIFTIQELKEKIESVVGVPDKIEYDEKVIAIFEYRDGSIIDVVRKVK